MPDSPFVPIAFEILGWVISTVALIMTALAAIHVAQHIERPEHKATWICLFALFPIIGSLVYFFTKYSKFQQIGKGGLIFKGSVEMSTFFDLTESEKTVGNPNKKPQIQSTLKVDDY